MGDVRHEHYTEVRTELQNAAVEAAVAVRPKDGEFHMRVLYHVLTRFRPHKLGPSGVRGYAFRCAEGIDEREAESPGAVLRGQLVVPCPVCGKTCRAVLPRGGDGSVYHPRVHGPRSNRCPGALDTVAP